MSRRPLGVAPWAAILLAAHVATWAEAAWAIPVTVTRVVYDDAKRRLTLDVTGEAEIRARQVDRRIILEIPDARLRGGTFSKNPGSKRVRSILVSQVAGNPPYVRVELALAPGIEPLLSVQQAAGHIYVLLSDPPPPEGERDLETFPTVPRGALPPLADRGSRVDRPRPQVIGTPAPAPPPRGQATPPPAAPPTPRPALAASTPRPEPVRPESRETFGTKSFAIFTFQQSEFTEAIPAKRLVGFPTGPAGLEVQQWLWDYVGLGLELRYLSWTGKGDYTADRQDGLSVLRLGARYPLGFVEPEVYFAGLTRFQAIGKISLWDLFAPAIGVGTRFQVADALGFRIWGQYFPIGIGADAQAFRLGTSVLVSLGPLLLSAGYTHDDTTVLGGKVTAETALVGAGVQW